MYELREKFQNRSDGNPVFQDELNATQLYGSVVILIRMNTVGTGTWTVFLVTCVIHDRSQRVSCASCFSSFLRSLVGCRLQNLVRTADVEKRKTLPHWYAVSSRSGTQR